MTDAWNERQLAQFAQLRNGLMKTGFSKDVAEAHARRTLEERNNRPERQRMGDGPTKDELYHEAKRFRITGRSKMDKAQLEAAVAQHRSGLRRR